MKHLVIRSLDQWIFLCNNLLILLNFLYWNQVIRQYVPSDSIFPQTIKIHHECEGRIEKSVPRFAIWHHEACRVMTNGDPQGRIFLSYPHTNNWFFFLLTTVFFYLKISFQKSLTTLRYNFTWWRHFNITMTSLNDNVCEFQYNQCMKPSHDSLGKIAWVRKDFLSQGKISNNHIWCARKYLPSDP